MRATQAGGADSASAIAHSVPSAVESAARGAVAAVPSVWLLMGHRAGDNTQVQALGEALGWPFDVKRFVYKPWERVLNLPFMATLAGVDAERSSMLEPPWPDLVLTAGRRNEPIARWIKAQSGGRTKLVHVGRPWAALARWDLVVTTPQYRLPQGSTVLHNEAPLHRVTPERLAKAAAVWGPRVAHLPRPRVTVLAGGPSGPYPFDAKSGARLAREASALAAKSGGSLLLTSSARTPAATVDALFAATIPTIRSSAFSRSRIRSSSPPTPSR
jgi:mitochondrial fission protein ELM1